MMAYFKPLRRKIGVMTLVIACVFLGGWIRSLSIADDIRFPNTAQTSWFIGSTGGKIGCTRWSGMTGTQIPVGGWVRTSILRNSMSVEDSLRENEFKIIFEWYGFCVALFESTTSSVCVQVWMVPYWSAVLPLTVVSAWLLLLKPRTKITPASENA